LREQNADVGSGSARSGRRRRSTGGVAE